MHKYLVFDLDGTLSQIGKGIASGNIKKLKRLEDAGYRIVVCSGKPAFYLCGFMRQVGLEAPIIIGENGGTIQFGVKLPPKKFLTHPCTEKAKEQLKNIMRKIEAACPGIWFQPNNTAVTPFFREVADLDRIKTVVEENLPKLSELTVYPQAECYDFTPKNISKGSGLELLACSEKADAKDFIAVGDGINDISMFEFSDISIKIGSKLGYDTDYSFENISEALDLIIYKRL